MPGRGKLANVGCVMRQNSPNNPEGCQSDEVSHKGDYNESSGLGNCGNNRKLSLATPLLSVEETRSRSGNKDQRPDYRTGHNSLFVRLLTAWTRGSRYGWGLGQAITCPWSALRFRSRMEGAPTTLLDDIPLIKDCHKIKLFR